MKRFICAALAVAAAVPGMAVNIISNPGFETGSMAPWFQSTDFGGPENWNVTSALSHTGTFSATDVGNKEIRQNFTAVSTSLITEVSFWVKNMDSSALVNFVTLFYDDSSSTGGLIFESSTDWEKIDVTSWMDSGKNLNGIAIFGFLGGGPDEDRTYLDDFVVESSVPEPATMSIVALGLAGFIAKRRRK